MRGVHDVHANIGHVGTIEVVNTFGVVNGVEGAMGDDMSTLAQHHADAWRQYVVPSLSSIYQHEQTLCYSLEDNTLAAGQATLGTAQVGGQTEAPLPLSVCFVAALKTDKRGRTFAGRSYLSPIGESHLAGDGHTWKAASVASFQQNLESYKAAVDPATNSNGALAICSKGSPLHQIQPQATKVTGIFVRAQIGTQRRRLS